MNKTADLIEMTLPWPPSVNHYWRTFRNRVIVSAAGRKYRDDIQAGLLGKGAVAPPGELHVRLDLYPPDRRRRDVDNVCKALLDALAHAGVYPDDSVIGELHVRRMCVLAGGRVVARITPRV
jgi:crossover junction endodeoxyribonuclease RusA